MRIYTDRILKRLEQLKNEVTNASSVDYCDTTPILASCLAHLPRDVAQLHAGICAWAVG